MTFSDGVFNGTAIEKLSIFSDGIVIISRSPTSFLETCLDYIKTWAEKEFEVQFINTHEDNIFYESQITVATPKPLLAPMESMTAVRRVIQDELKRNSGFASEFEDAGISFAIDPSKSVNKPSAFKVERKAGVDFSYNQYFSIAPLKTDSHLKALKALAALG